MAVEGTIPMRRGRRWTAVVVWALLLGLLGIVGAGVIRSQGGPVAVDARAPDFSLTTFDGGTVHLSDLRGQVVVINFWASWCKPCEEEAESLEQAYRIFKDQGVVFLGVDYVDTEPEARAYLERFAITYPNGPDLGTRISQAFRIGGVPETFVVRADGTIDSVQIGPYPSLDRVIEAVESARSP